MKKIINIILVLSVFLLTLPSVTNTAYAAALTDLSDTMSNQTTGAVSSHAIRFTTPTGLNANGQTIVITFDSAFDFTSKTIGSVSFTHDASAGTTIGESLASSPSTSQWGAVFSGTNNSILTLTAPTDGVGTAAVAPGDKVIITYDNTNSINPAQGYYNVDINANGDVGSLTVPVLSNSQVAISATVSQSFTFSVSNNSIGFGTLSAGATRFATSDSVGSNAEPVSGYAHQLSASANASSGYSIAVSGTTLTSGLNTITGISGGSAVALAPGTEQFGIRGSVASGTGTVAAPFDGTASTSYGFGSATTITSQQFASTPGVSTTSTYDVNYAANIAPLTEAGSYTTTLTYVGTANF